MFFFFFFFSSRSRHTRLQGDWSSDVCSSDLAEDRALRETLDVPARLRAEPGDDPVADLAAKFGIADDTALPHSSLADLELRLDERHQSRALRRQSKRHRQHRLEADEARVANDEINGLRHLGAREVAGVDPLEQHDPRVRPELRRELAVADIDGINASYAASEQHVAEAARRGADVECDGAC